MEPSLRVIDSGKLEKILLSRSIYRKANKAEVSFEDFLINITNWITTILDCTGVYIFMDDPINKRLKLSKNKLILISQYSREENLVGISTSAGANNSIARAYREQEIINYPLDNHPQSIFERKFNQSASLAIPIQIKSSPIGVLFLTRKVKNNFSEKKYDLVNIITDFVATTIANFLDTNRSYHLSITDNLTGLYNDRYFHESLFLDIEECVHSRVPLHLVFFDLDNLKKVNDSHGHLAGSTVLSEIGVIIKKQRRKIWAARYGGDEFVLVIKEHRKEEVLEWMEDLRTSIESYVFLERTFFGQTPLFLKGIITASFGVASLDNVIEPSVGKGSGFVYDINKIKNILLKKSDEAMYLAKTTGKNKVVYSAE